MVIANKGSLIIETGVTLTINGSNSITNNSGGIILDLNKLTDNSIVGGTLTNNGTRKNYDSTGKMILDIDTLQLRQDLIITNGKTIEIDRVTNLDIKLWVI